MEAANLGVEEHEVGQRGQNLEMLSSSFTESGVQVERQTSEFIRNCTIIETVLEVTTRFLGST